MKFRKFSIIPYDEQEPTWYEVINHIYMWYTCVSRQRTLLSLAKLHLEVIHMASNPL